MEDTNCYLFVYGTLLDSENEYGSYLSKNCSFYSHGKFKGKLYDIGEYPGAVYRPYEELFVYGDVFIMQTPDDTFKVLDEYEGFGENEPQPNLFVRELIEIETSAAVVKCWTYLFNSPIDGLNQIISGRYNFKR